MNLSALRIGIIGDFNPNNESHVATDAALGHAAKSLGRTVESTWLPTPTLNGDAGSRVLSQFDGLVCAPGSPYADMEGALSAIRFAREKDRPFIGTCGGFQHAVIEFARNVLSVRDAEHEESAPGAPTLFISRLACSLVGQKAKVIVLPQTRLASAFGVSESVEQFWCNFGVNPAFAPRLEQGGLIVCARDETGAIRAVELTGNRFFVATLFIPQFSSTEERPHPLVVAFVRAAGAVGHSAPIK